LFSSLRRGGRDIKKNAAKQPLMERTGWSSAENRWECILKHLGLRDHPVCGVKVGFANFFFMPQPPLLNQLNNHTLDSAGAFWAV
jgi:hypothetical protein